MGAQEQAEPARRGRPGRPAWAPGASRPARPAWAARTAPGADRGHGPFWLRPSGRTPRQAAGPPGPGVSGPRASGPRGSGPGGSGPGGAAPGGAGRWLAVRAAALLAIIVALATAAGFALQREDSGPAAGWARSSGHDALWMGHAWVTAGPGGRSEADLSTLAARIRASGIRDVYVRVGPLDDTGRLDPARYRGAGGFLTRFRTALPQVRVSAWIGGVTGAGHINLGSAAARDRIVAGAAAALRAGFSGVHYDLEPVESGDTGLLALLDATRRLHPAPLSVAAPKLEPLPGLRLPAQLATGRPVFWSTGYLAAVSSRASQVAVMSYDTGMPFQSWYGGYVARETGLALRAVPRGTDVLIGLPAYHGSDLGHHASAETVSAAVQGVRAAVTAAGRAAVPPGRLGVALFADYSATPMDWESYRHGWVRP